MVESSSPPLDNRFKWAVYDFPSVVRLLRPGAHLEFRDAAGHLLIQHLVWSWLLREAELGVVGVHQLRVGSRCNARFQIVLDDAGFPSRG